MANQFSRTQLLIGEQAVRKLAESRVAVFGIGGVGGYTVEALVRSGIGKIDIIDDDTVSLTNLNRQIIATHSSVGRAKVDVAEERIHDINPDCEVRKFKTFYTPETAGEFDFSQYDYVVDAIDTVTGKIELVMNAQKCGTPIISSMGMGNKINAAMIEVADIYKTSVCPLARVMRYELKKRRVKKLKVVYSKEQAMTPIAEESENYDKSTDTAPETRTGNMKKSVPGSTAFVPSAAGLIIAGEIIKDLTGIRNK